MNTTLQSHRTRDRVWAIGLIVGGAAIGVWANRSAIDGVAGLIEQDSGSAWVQEHNRATPHPVQDISEMTTDERIAAGMRHMDVSRLATRRELADIHQAMMIQVGAAVLVLVGSIVGLGTLRRPRLKQGETVNTAYGWAELGAESTAR